MPDLDILVDGELLPQSVDWDQPLIGRDEVGARDEVSFLIPADTKVVTFADRFAGELLPITEVVLPELPSEWSQRFAPATSSSDLGSRLYSGGSLCGHITLEEIEAGTGGVWAGTGVSADPWTRQSANDGYWEVQCLVSVSVDEAFTSVSISARGCGEFPCEEASLAPTGRRFDGFVVDVTTDSYNPVQVADEALDRLLVLATSGLEG